MSLTMSLADQRCHFQEQWAKVFALVQAAES
jgi:hypothetical protein